MQGYRTVVFNAVMALMALARMAFPEIVLPEDEQIANILEAVWAIVTLSGNAGLRIFKTKGPFGVKDPVCK